MSVLASIAVMTAAMLAPDPIRSRLDELQATLSARADPPPKSVMYDERTVIAGYRWQDEDGPNGLVVAYRLTKAGTLKRLADFRYGDDPTQLAIVDGYVVVTGTQNVIEILEWDGRHFSELGETSASAHLADLDGDGVPEAIALTAAGAPYVDRFDDGAVVDLPAPDLEDFIDVVKTSGDPESVEQPLRGGSPVTLRIIEGRPRATSIRITDEAGTEIAPGTRVNASRLRVTVSGPPGAHVTVLVNASRAR